MQDIKKRYFLDNHALLLFLLVSFSFESSFEYIIPLLIGFSLVQFYRLLKNKLSQDQFFYTYFYLLVYTTIFYKSIQTIILIVLLLFLTVLYFKTKPKIQLKFIKPEIYILIFFVLITINLMLFEPQFKGLDKYLYLLFFPIIFLLLKKLSFTIDKLKTMRILIASVLIATIFLVFLNLYNSTIQLKTNTFFAEPLDLTHVYFGMFLALAGCFLLILFKEGNSFISRKADLVIFLFILMLLIYIGARISLLALLLILAIVFFQKVQLNWFKKTILFLVLSFIFINLSYKIPRVEKGVKEVQKIHMSVKTNDKDDLINNSWRNMNVRFLLIDYTIKEIKEHWALGVGMQNVKEKVSNRIVKDGYIHFWGANTHNQFLQIWVGMGVFSLLFFLVMIFNFYKLQTYSLYFLTFFLIIMLTESILVRVKGISLFFLFSLIFSLKERFSYD